MGFYDDMADVASEVMAEFKQGTVTLTRTTFAATDPETPWVPGTPFVTVYALDATVKRVEQQYIDGTLILGTEDQATFPPIQIEPAMTDKVTIDGVVRELVALKRIPAAGTPVVFVAIVKS